jgi:uncharacterized protein with gpF-like domain
MTAPDPDAAERSIREAVWAALSDWLIRLSRRVLREGQRPDLDAVWAEAPSWRDLVDRTILPAIQRVYESTMGSDFPYEARVFMTRYLAEVRNRLVRVPDEVYDLIAGQVAEGVNLGDGIPELSARIAETLDTAGSERWPNRATMIARTEAIGALNSARLESFQEMAKDEGGDFEKVWVATVGDGRTRETHREADGQRVPLDQPFIVGGFPLMFPGDPSGPPQEVIGCRCTMLMTEPLEEIDYTNRQYRDR